MQLHTASQRTTAGLGRAGRCSSLCSLIQQKPWITSCRFVFRSVDRLLWADIFGYLAIQIYCLAHGTLVALPPGRQELR